jgi:hypothetical protein
MQHVLAEKEESLQLLLARRGTSGICARPADGQQLD